MITLDGRHSKRRELFEARDQIDVQRDNLISGLKKLLRQKVNSRPLVAVRWTMYA